MTTIIHSENIDWEVSENAAKKKRQAFLLVMAISGWVLFIIALAALIMAYPFMRPYPVTIKVDRLTGTTETVIGYDIPKKGSRDFELLAKADLIEHVRCRVGFTRGEAQRCYERVMAQSVGTLKGEWDNYYHTDKNPNAPLKIYGAADQILLSKPSVTFIPTNNEGEYVAQVRFDRITKINSVAPTIRRMNATFTFKYSKLNIPENVDLQPLNPLGFAVINYRTEAEGSEQPYFAPALGAQQ
jgi:type IV secretory pathway component VirB8